MKSRSFASNSAANLVSQVAVALMALVAVPWLLRLLGSEGYGLAAFYALLLQLFMLLDLGLGALVLRQTARARAGGMPVERYLSLVRTVEAFFVAVAAVVSAGVWLGAGWIAEIWLDGNDLDQDVIRRSVELMAISCGLRWMQSLYKGILAGLEQFLWLSGFNFLFGAARFLLVIPVISLLGGDEPILVYLIFQTLLSAVELAVVYLRKRSTDKLWKIPADSKVTVQFAVVRSELRFTLLLTYSAIVWVLVLRSADIILSTTLPLTEFGVFSLAVSAAALVVLVATPVASVIQPRLTAVVAKSSGETLQASYLSFSAFLGWLALPLGLGLAFAAEPAVAVWTGDEVLAEKAGPVLSLFALGNAILGICQMCYLIQFARGDLRLHTIANTIFLALIVPAQIVLSTNFGATGAGWAWLGLNVLYLVVWTPVVNHKMLPGVHGVWLRRAFLAPTLVVVPGLAGIWLVSSSYDQLGSWALVALTAGWCGLCLMLGLWRAVRQLPPQPVAEDSGLPAALPQPGQSGDVKEETRE